MFPPVVVVRILCDVATLAFFGNSCGIMNSFFYTQLSDNGRGYRYQGVKRFLKKAKVKKKERKSACVCRVTIEMLKKS